MLEISNDKIANWIFDRLIELLNGKNSSIDGVIVVFKKLNKTPPKKVGKEYEAELLGEVKGEDDIWTIYIESRVSERTKIRVFFHENIHLLFPGLKEKPIRELEHLLWPLFSEDQKQLLKDYMYQLSKKSA